MEPQPRCPCFNDSAELSPWAPDTRLSWEWKKPKERLNLCCLLTPASHARGLLSLETASRNSLLSKQPSHRRTFLRNSAQRRSAMFDLLKLLSYLLEQAGEKMSKWHPQDVSEHWEFVIRLWDRQILYPIDQEDMGYWGKTMLFCSLSLLLWQITFPRVTPNSSEYWFFSVPAWHLRWLKRFNVRSWRKKREAEQWCRMGSAACNPSIIHTRWQGRWILSHFPSVLFCCLPQMCC